MPEAEKATGRSIERPRRRGSKARAQQSRPILSVFSEVTLSSRWGLQAHYINLISIILSSACVAREQWLTSLVTSAEHMYTKTERGP